MEQWCCYLGKGSLLKDTFDIHLSLGPSVCRSSLECCSKGLLAICSSFAVGLPSFQNHDSVLSVNYKLTSLRYSIIATDGNKESSEQKKGWEVLRMRKGRLNEKAAQSAVFHWRKFALWNKGSRETPNPRICQGSPKGCLSYLPSHYYKIPGKGYVRKSFFGLAVPGNICPFRAGKLWRQEPEAAVTLCP